MSINAQVTYAKERPILVGVFTVLAVFTVGVGMAFATGMVTPSQVMAQVAPPCCTPPPPPPPPPPPVVVTPPTVVETTPPPAPTCSLSATNSTVQQGYGTTLYWSTNNATSVSISGGVGSVSNNGTSGVSPWQTTTYDLTATSAGGTIHCYTTVTVTVPTPAPTCSLSASPTSIQQGGSSTLSWSTNNATSVSINQSVGAVGTNGTRSVSPTQTTNYDLTATGAGGTVHCYTTVTVTVVTPAPTCTLTANPTTITSGGYSVLSWGTTNATNVSITSLGQVGTYGQYNVTPNQTTNYTLTATGAGGTVHCYATVSVNTPPPPPTCTLTATPSTIATGGSATLAWTTSNASSVSLNNGIGQVSPGGSMNVSPLWNTTYDLTATGAGGTVHCQASVSVNQQPPTCTLTANPTTIQQNGVSTLTWTTTNATNVSISPAIGGVAANGSMNVAPTQNSNYTLTASGAGGTVNCYATVTVSNPPPPPTCTLSANPATITSGGYSALTWGTTNATSVSITSLGQVSTYGSYNVTPNQTTTYDLTATGQGGIVHCYTTVSVNQPPPAPTCTLTANPTSITQGSSATLAWTTSNATSVSVTGFGAVSPGGSVSVSPMQNTNYDLTATGAGGTVHCYAQIQVTQVEPPTCTLSANPATITSGGYSVLTWGTTHATNVTITSVGQVSSYGSTNVTPTQTTNYTLTATGQGGTVNCYTTVSVSQPPPAPTCTLSANPTQITSGGSATLAWTTSNATSVSLNNGIGPVSPGGSMNVSPLWNTNYDLVATGAGGTVHCYATVAVNTPPPAPTCTLTANPTSVLSGGYATLSWTTTNASAVSISGWGSVANSGFVNVTPTQSTTYDLTATGAGGTVHCTAPVTVVAPPAPTCTLSASPSNIQQGSGTTLTWSTTGANSMTIDNGVGSVQPVSGGSRTVSPTQTTTYFATATGPGGTVNCQTTVVVTVPPPTPTCTLTASPSSVTAGGSSTLNWVSSNATSASINGQSVSPVAGGAVTVTPTQTTTYVMTASGAGGSVNCQTTVTVVPPSAPTCSISAVPTTITQGSAATLTWNTSNTSGVSVTPLPANTIVNGNGSVVVSPTVTTTYNLTATGPGGTVNCSTTIVVVQPPAPTCTLTATPSSVQQGASSNLAWSTTNATSVSLDQAIGGVATAGTRAVTPSQTTTYNLTATGPGGTVNCTAAVTVTALPPPPAPTCTLTASPTSINYGGTSTLTWNTTNATTVTLNNNITVVNLVTSGTGAVNPLQTTTYNLTATGAGGTVNCQTTVTVVTPAPTCTLTANPGTVQNGGVATLTWNTTNASSFTVDQGVGSMSPVAGGSTSVTVNGSRTYTGTATGPGGTVTCATTVSVNTYRPGPSCSMHLSPSTIDDGDDAELTWDSDHVDHVRINQGVGNVSDGGSRNVSPNGSGTYTYEGTFYGDNGDTITCSATLRVRANEQHIVLDSLPVVNDQPLSYVYLSDLPYTGLDLGPVGTAMYWLTLILWSLAIAYLVLFNVVPFALRRVGIVATSTHPVAHEEVHEEVVHAAPHGYVPVSVPSVHAPAPVAPIAQSVAALPATGRTYASYEGFKSMASDGVLTIDDIVKGLAREAQQHVYVAPQAVPVAAHAPVAPSMPTHVAPAPVARVESLEATHANVPAFITALLAGEKDTVFGMIREITKAGGDAQAFLTHTVFALDDAYRALMDGTAVHPDIARVCEGCAPSFLERIITSLSTAVDSSYSAGTTGVKLAVTRALNVVEG